MKNINVSEMTIENGLDITPEEIRDIFNDSMKEIYVDNVHVATMTEYDYNEYAKCLGKTVEEDAKELYERKEDLLRKYPDSDIASIIGYILSERLYDKELR